MPKPARRSPWMLLATLLWGCGDQGAEPPPPPTDQLTAYVTVEPDTITPGASSIVTFGARCADNQTLSEFRLSVRALAFDTVMNFPVIDRGPLQYRLGIQVPTAPIEDTLHFDVFARMRSAVDSAHAVLVIRDDGPPQLEVAVSEIIEPPAWMLAVNYEAHDAAGITRLRIQIDGAVRRDTTITVDYEAALAGTMAVSIPPTTSLGDSAVVLATLRDGFGKETVVQRLSRVADTTAPNLAFTIDTVPHPEFDQTMFPFAFFPGDTLRVGLGLSDNHSLAYVGYRMLAFGDSALLGSASDSIRFEYEIPPGTNDAYAFIDVFATDSSGNRAEQRAHSVVMEGDLRPVTVLDPYATPLIDWDQQGNYALDLKRDVLYVADFGPRLSVVALGRVTERVIDFGASVRSVDLFPGGDSVAVVVEGRPNLLLIWDIDRGPSEIDTIPLAFPSDCDVWDMSVAANGHALVTGWSRSICPTIDVDLTSGTQWYRDVPDTLRSLTRSDDQRVIILWNQANVMIYWSDTDSLSTLRNLFPNYPLDVRHAGPSMDRTGSTVLIRNRLYEPDLGTYRWILPDPGYDPSAQVLSADGATAYIGNWPGYWKVDVATGTVGEKLILPRYADRMIAHPDGRRLIVFGWQWLGIVDLQ